MSYLSIRFLWLDIILSSSLFLIVLFFLVHRLYFCTPVCSVCDHFLLSFSLHCLTNPHTYRHLNYPFSRHCLINSHTYCTVNDSLWFFAGVSWKLWPEHRCVSRTRVQDPCALREVLGADVESVYCHESGAIRLCACVGDKLLQSETLTCTHVCYQYYFRTKALVQVFSIQSSLKMAAIDWHKLNFVDQANYPKAIEEWRHISNTRYLFTFPNVTRRNLVFWNLMFVSCKVHHHQQQQQQQQQQQYWVTPKFTRSFQVVPGTTKFFFLEKGSKYNRLSRR